MIPDPTEDPYPISPGEEAIKLTEVKRFIESADIPNDLKPEIIARAHQFLTLKRKTDPPNVKHYGGKLGSTYWVIRNDQLNAVVSLSPSAVAIATYATVAAASPWVAAATLLCSVSAIGLKLKEKSGVLDSADYEVLMALKQSGRTTPLGLANFLNGVKLFGSGIWSEQRILETLKRLQAFPVRDGSIEALVAQTPDGLWGTNGI